MTSPSKRSEGEDKRNPLKAQVQPPQVDQKGINRRGRDCDVCPSKRQPNRWRQPEGVRSPSPAGKDLQRAHVILYDYIILYIYYAILYYIMLYYILLYYTILYYIILCYIISSCLIVSYLVLHYINLSYLVLSSIILPYIILYYMILYSVVL